jgi:hypothetical protein
MVGEPGGRRAKVIDHPRPSDERQGTVPHPDTLLAAGLLSVLGGVWLLRLHDPFLLTLWGVAALLFGAVLIVLSLGLLLRLWE